MIGEELSRGEPAPVDVAALEKELGRLWKDEASGSPEEGAVTRACLLNFVVLDCMATPSPGLPEEMAAVFRARPCRILKLEVGGGGDGEVKAWISAHCVRPTREEKQVCCEQITLRAGAGGAAHLPSLVRALTVSDLPVFLYLPDGPPPDAALLRDLAAASDRLIVDSGGLGLDELRRLAKLGGLADLGWGRLLGLRDAVADLFDSPLLAPLLEKIRAVRTSGGPETETAASLLHGWVRAALDRPRLEAAHETLSAEQAGRLGRLVLEAGEETRIVAEREQGGDLILARAEMPGTCPLPRRLRHPERPDAALLCDEVDRPAADGLFLEALERAGPQG